MNNSNLEKAQKKTIKRLMWAAIILMILTAVMAFLLLTLNVLRWIKDFEDELYDPCDGAITVINSPDKSAQIIVREGQHLGGTETRFYYKKVGSSKEYLIGEVGLGEVGSPFFEGCKHQITWSENEVEIKLKTQRNDDEWLMPLVFVFPK